jgi:hypothetical protein
MHLRGYIQVYMELGPVVGHDPRLQSQLAHGLPVQLS